jgi:hypothetical protein
MNTRKVRSSWSITKPLKAIWNLAPVRKAGFWMCCWLRGGVGDGVVSKLLAPCAIKVSILKGCSRFDTSDDYSHLLRDHGYRNCDFCQAASCMCSGSTYGGVLRLKYSRTPDYHCQAKRCRLLEILRNGKFNVVK